MTESLLTKDHRKKVFYLFYYASAITALAYMQTMS